MGMSGTIIAEPAIAPEHSGTSEEVEMLCRQKDAMLAKLESVLQELDDKIEQEAVRQSEMVKRRKGIDERWSALEARLSERTAMISKLEEQSARHAAELKALIAGRSDSLSATQRSTDDDNKARAPQHSGVKLQELTCSQALPTIAIFAAFVAVVLAKNPKMFHA